jgi:hypothetical protein
MVNKNEIYFLKNIIKIISHQGVLFGLPTRFGMVPGS